MGFLPSTINIDALEYAESSNNTFIASNGQIVGMDDGLEAVRQAVQIMLTTERYQYQIYTDNFGIDTSDIIGANPDYIRTVFPAKVNDALSLDERILGTQNYTYDFKSDSVIVSFDVLTVYGTFKEEVNL